MQILFMKFLLKLEQNLIKLCTFALYSNTQTDLLNSVIKKWKIKLYR